MVVSSFNILGKLGSFQRPQNNNAPSTFSIIPKSALIGMMCAVNGIERKQASELYVSLSNDIKYSVKLNKQFQIKSTSEYRFNAKNIKKSGRELYTPGKYEKLVDIDYEVYLLYDVNNDIVNNFIENVKNEHHIFTPYLGMSDMFAEINFIDTFKNHTTDCGVFETNSFCTNLEFSDDLPFENIRTESLPTLSNGYLSHDNDSYVDIYFHEKGGELLANGNHYILENGKKIEFI